MPGSRATNKAMFWRIIRRLLGANRARLFVMLLALGAGAAVTAALLNLQVDAKRRLTTEFRAFGPNVLIIPKGSLAASSETLPESTIHLVPVNLPSGRVAVSSILYMVASVFVPQSGILWRFSEFQLLFLQPLRPIRMGQSYR